MVHYINMFKKYATFKGRTGREEFWWAFFINLIIALVLGRTDLSRTYLLITFVPFLALSVRRLHDTGKSGLMMLIAMIPMVGQILYIIFLATDSQPGSNKYGENPKTIGGVYSNE